VGAVGDLSRFKLGAPNPNLAKPVDMSKLNFELVSKTHDTAPSGILVETGSGSVFYQSRDSLQRPTGVYASITSDMIGPSGPGTLPNPMIKPPGWAGNGTLNNQARGHLFAKQLGGSGDMAENLVTLQQNWVNTPVMRGFENQVRMGAQPGEIIQYSAVPNYRGTNLIPRGVTLIGNGNNGFNLGVTVLNPIGFY
jgi:hypothetical protein